MCSYNGYQEYCYYKISLVAFYHYFVNTDYDNGQIKNVTMVANDGPKLIQNIVSQYMYALLCTLITVI